VQTLPLSLSLPVANIEYIHKHSFPARMPAGNSADGGAGVLQLLEHVGTTHPEVLKLIILNMSEDGAACLRLVNRGMRRTINRTVTALEVKMAATLPRSDLAASFPDADRLRVMLFSDARSENPNSRNTGSATTATFLRRIWSSSPMLVAKLDTLEICLPPTLRPNSIAGVVAECLVRCARSLNQGMHLQHNATRFWGSAQSS
jgi:hypothetical protein